MGPRFLRTVCSLGTLNGDLVKINRRAMGEGFEKKKKEKVIHYLWNRWKSVDGFHSENESKPWEKNGRWKGKFIIVWRSKGWLLLVLKYWGSVWVKIIVSYILGYQAVLDANTRSFGIFHSPWADAWRTLTSWIILPWIQTFYIWNDFCGSWKDL